MPSSGDEEMTPPGNDMLSEEVLVQVASLIFGFSPRFVPEDLEFVRALAELPANRLPPIWVHAETMTVIDGRHRVLAARLRDEKTIRARLHHGTLEEAFLMAVELNVPHGKPLTYGEKLRSACLLLTEMPGTEDSTVADVCGLSPATVSRLHGVKGCTFKDSGTHDRTRLLSSQVARREAGQIMLSFPEESNRKIAREVGLSEPAVRSIRRNMNRVECLSFPVNVSGPLPALHNSPKSRARRLKAPERSRCVPCAVWLSESLSKVALRRLLLDGHPARVPTSLMQTLDILDELSRQREVHS